MSRTRRNTRRPEQHDKPEGATPQPPAVTTLLSVQRSAGNHAASRLIQRTHPAFNQVNFWKPSLPAVDDIPAQPAPGSPEAVMQRLKSKFSERVAELLLYTDADGQDALDREPMTATFLADGGTDAEAIQYLTAHPKDNDALREAYELCIAGKRQAVTDDFIEQGGDREEAKRLQEKHKRGVAPLELAYHEDRLGPLRERATQALTGLWRLERARHAMDLPQNITVPQITAMQMKILDGIQRISKTREGSSRSELLAAIKEAEDWVNPREPFVAAIPTEVREILFGNQSLYREARAVVKQLFKTETFDPKAFNAAYDEWNRQVPMTRSKAKTPRQLIDDLAGKLAGTWAIAKELAQPYARKFISAGKSETVDKLIGKAVSKATWDGLVSEIGFDEAVLAADHASLENDDDFQALVTRLKRSVLTGANLTKIALDQPTTATLCKGRFFRFNADGTIETEVSVLWNKDLYMPSSRRGWGEIHIHYSGKVAKKEDITYVHLKIDRAIAGGTPISTGHPVIQTIYDERLVDPTWTLTD